jgi:hypothetical protein
LSSPSNLFNWFFEPTEPIATFTNKSNNAKKGVHSIVFMNGTKPAFEGSKPQTLQKTEIGPGLTQCIIAKVIHF